MTSVSKRSSSLSSFPKLSLREVVKISKVEEDDPFGETYWTETIDFSANGEDGSKLFESFHILAVPETRLGDFERLRAQLRKDMVSELQDAFQSLRHG